MRKKLLENLAVSFLFFLIVAIFRFKFPLWLLFFGLGGLLGTFILELEGIMSIKFEIKSRVFHTFLFQVIFAVLTLYVLTSTASAIASGISFFAYLHLLKDQAADLSRENLAGWGGFFGLSVPRNLQNIWVGAGTVFLFYLLFLLIR